MADNLSAKTIEGLSLALEGVDDVHGGDSLTASVLGVGDRVTDDVLKEDLEHTTGLLVDETGDTLDTATTSETADGGLGDALDVITKDLAMTLGASLSKTFTPFSATRHDECLLEVVAAMTTKLVLWHHRVRSVLISVCFVVLSRRLLKKPVRRKPRIFIPQVETSSID
ncbi:hypothetical protein ACHAXR_001831 [Thalassiosira sp. AJA248-18]